MRTRQRSIAIWVAVGLVGAIAWGVIALVRDEQISAAWLIAAAVGSYAIAYRFYARFIQYKVLGADANRATPAERLNNDVDFQPTDRRVLFGHHFAAIAGAGPLVGPVLAAQMGYLPGTIWIIVGVIFAGAVQDMVVLFFSMRRDGKSLGQMARDEIGPVGGAAALIAVLVDHGDPAGRAGAGRRQCAGELAVGHVQPRDDDPDRAVHGLLHARDPARARAGDERDRRHAAPARDRARRRGAGLEPRRRLHARARDARLLPDRVRLRGHHPAGLDAARPARLPLDLHEDRDDPAAGDRHPGHAAGAQERGRHEVRDVRRPARSSPARCSRSCSSRSPAARCRASTP